MLQVSTAVRNTTAVGIIVAFVSLLVLPGFPPLAFVFGMFATVFLLFLSGDGRKRYALSGTFYFVCLGVGVAVLANLGMVPHAGTMSVALLVFGVPSLLWVTVNDVGETLFDKAVDRFTDDDDSETEELGFVFAVVEFAFVLADLSKRAFILVGSVIGGLATSVLFLFGFEAVVTVPVVEFELSVVLFLFFPCLLGGFYAVDWVNETWQTTKETVTEGQKTGQFIHSKASETLEERREQKADGNED